MIPNFSSLLTFSTGVGGSGVGVSGVGVSGVGVSGVGASASVEITTSLWTGTPGGVTAGQTGSEFSLSVSTPTLKWRKIYNQAIFMTSQYTFITEWKELPYHMSGGSIYCSLLAHCLGMNTHCYFLL